jgi:hypothetical protein
MPRSASSVTLKGSQGTQGAQHIGAKMIGGAAERHGQAEACERRQQQAEMDGVFKRELARQPVVTGIVDAEAGLQAGNIGRRRCKSRGGETQLLGIGHVLGVEDRDEIAARESERVIERLGFRLRRAARHDDDLEMGRQRQRADMPEHVHIIRLEYDFDVEAMGGIVAALSSKRTKP